MEQSKTSAGISAESAAKARSEISITRRYFADMLILMVVPAVMAWYYYGGRAVRLMVLSVLTAVLCEAAGSFIFKAQASVSDLSAVATGLMTSLCMPASAPYYLPCIASAFAVIVAKLPFGNARSHMFTPAAAGIAFVTICMPDRVFSYPAILSSGTTAVSGGQGFFPGTSIAYMLSQKNSVGTGLLNYVDVLVGSVSGPMGATCSIALFGALLFLAVRRPKNFTVSVSFLAVCFIYALLFPRVLTGRFVSAFMEICGGTLLFSSVFFLTDDKLLPKSFYSRICYGAAAGLMCMIMRSVGKFEDSTVFAVLLANGLVTAFDKLPLTKRERHLVAAENAKRDGVDLRLYRIIYDCIEEIGDAMKGMLAPKTREVLHGRAEVRQVYKITGVGTIAGCYILDGKVYRNDLLRIVREGIIVGDDKMISLRRFKDDVKEGAQGYECGIGLERFTDIREGDIYETYVIEEYRD